MNEPWRIELFGGLRASQNGRVINRFRTQKTGALLAYLAYYGRAHAREALSELLWPQHEPAAARQSLRTSLSSLRHQLEAPGVVPGAVVQANHFAIELNPCAITTDVAEFEAALGINNGTRPHVPDVESLARAIDLYQGPLLAGYYEDWIPAEEHRLEQLYFHALQQLLEHLEQAGDYERALQYAQRGVCANPLREDANTSLIRLYATLRQPASALRQYQEFEHWLKQETEQPPPAAMRALVRDIEVAIGADAASPQQSKAARPALPASLNQPILKEVADAAANLRPEVHLPIQFTRFFGREAEMSRLQEMLTTEKARLVTLTGAAGSGKTRLSIESASRLASALRCGVWFVPLADVNDPRLILHAIADAMGVAREPDVGALEQITSALRRPCLLILDNFEHLLGEGAALVRALLARVPHLICMVTSRHEMKLEGERKLAVLPLSTPPQPEAHGVPISPEQLTEFAGVQLFVDRAQAVRCDFQVTPANAAAVAQVCRHLEGIPLALELAAARIGVLTPAQMAAQLDARLDCFASRQRDVPARHRTLRAAIQWSYQLLAPELQRFFCRLTVFRGGWTAAAAKAVCETGSTQDKGWTLDYLAHLRGCSLIVTAESDGEMRFRMLETLREFAAEQLAQDERAALQRRHAEYYAGIAREIRTDLWTPRQFENQKPIIVEQENLRTVVTWAVENEPEMAVELMTTIDLSATSLEVRDWMERVLEALQHNHSISPATRARALNAAASLSIQHGDYAVARSYAESALALWRELEGHPDRSIRDHIVRLPDALGYLAVIAMNQGDFDKARSTMEECLALEEKRWSSPNLPISSRTIHSRLAGNLCLIGELAFNQANFAEAIRIFEQTIALAREHSSRQVLATQLVFLADAARCEGDCERAAVLLEESQALWRELSRPSELLFLSQGRLARQQNDYERATTLFKEALSIARGQGFKRGILNCLAALASIAALQLQAERAARICGAVEARFEAMGAVMYPADRIDYDADVATARAFLTSKKFATAWAAGRAMSWEAAIKCALQV